ncbi:SDR family NAD(P)-dependent oxidoreductase [Streptomyces sp. URMC 126]|uniref:SDR family NAD(P)-dependent oxidoreductase n=1 Tax=Streptomyces sp. URMC 126 TaxID=3423401 RepID=UPI003F19AEA1
MPPAETSQPSQPSTAPTTPEGPDTLLFPASYAQQRMWFFHHLDRGNPYYNIPLALRLTGEADPAALQAALDGVVARHEILRTTFTERDGEPRQLVAPAGRVRLETAECAPEDEHPWALEWVGRPFDLTTGPLFRAALLTTAPDRHLLLLCLHHIVTDGWSLNVLTRELAAFYREYRTGEPAGLAPLEIQYADFAEWQREQLDGAALERRLDYWRRQLRDAPAALDLPTDHPRPPVQSFRGARVDFELPDDLARALRATGRAHGTTLFMTLLAGVTALLHRWTGQDDILVGSPIAGRDVPETEPLLGLFVNTLVLRGDLSGSPTFADLLARTRRACTGAYDHQDVPLDKLVEVLRPERDPGRNPLFQVMFALQNPPRMDFPLPGARLRAEPLPRHSTRFDLEFHLWEDGDRLHGSLVYGTDLFDPETAARTPDRLRRLLAAAVRAPETPVADLPFADTEPTTPVRAPADPDTTVPAAFAERVRRAPDGIAVTGGAAERAGAGALGGAAEEDSGERDAVVDTGDALVRSAAEESRYAQGAHATAEALARPAERDRRAAAVTDGARAGSAAEGDRNAPGAAAPAGTLTAAGLAERADVLAGRLAARGITRGTRVGLRLPPGADAAAATLALLTLGAVCVPVEPESPDGPACDWLVAAGARTLLTDRAWTLPTQVTAVELAALKTDAPETPQDRPAGPNDDHPPTTPEPGLTTPDVPTTVPADVSTPPADDDPETPSTSTAGPDRDAPASAPAATPPTAGTGGSHPAAAPETGPLTLGAAGPGVPRHPATAPVGVSTTAAGDDPETPSSSTAGPNGDALTSETNDGHPATARADVSTSATGDSPETPSTSTAGPNGDTPASAPTATPPTAGTGGSHPPATPETGLTTPNVPNDPATVPADVSAITAPPGPEAPASPAAAHRAEAAPRPFSGPRGADPAFVLRGAAGPVEYGHAALCATLDRLQDLGRLGAGDAVLYHRTAPLPDAVHALLWPLLYGAAVYAAPGVGPGRVAAAVAGGGVSVALLPPAALDEAARAERPSDDRLRLVLVDGGRLTARLADRFLAARPETVLHRLWVLPEAAGCVAALRCRPGLTDAELAAGRDDHRPVVVTDERGRPLPSGVPGRLSVHRPGAAAPAPTPWRGRRLHDGRLAVADDAPPRVDGYAVDLAAVENALLADETLAGCAVLPRTTADGVEELVAYAVPTGPFSARRARERAAALLPAALVPRAVVPVTSLPRDRSGRLDAAALAALPVVDEDAARAWERELTASGGPAVAVLVEEAAPEPEERVHVPLPTPEDPREPAGDGEEPRPAAPADGGRPAVAAGPPAVTPSVRTLPEALRRAARENRGGIVIVDRRGAEQELSYPDLAADAARVLGGLRAIGLRPGDRAVLQCPGHRDFLTAFWACLLGGFVPVPLAPAESYAEDTSAVERLAGAWELLGRPLVLAGDETADGLRGLAARRGWGTALRVGVLDELRRHAPDPDEHPCAPDDVALLLLTSGSTGTPKAVPLRHRNVLARCAGTAAANGFGAGDVTFNWMPLDHVGGIVMFHVRDVYLTCRQVHAPTGWVLEDPPRWLDVVHRHRVTLTWAPNFAFGLVNDRVADAAGRGWDLSCLRFIQNAGEAIMPRVARRFLQALAPYGLPATAMRPSWGMSETSSAVTYSDAFTLATTSDADPFTEVGRPLPGTTLRIVDDAGETVPEGVPGRLQVSGPTVTSGYHDNEEENRASFTPDGWFETGDLGVIRDGAVTITGRAKDVLIINGVNHYCHEIESVVEELDRVENSFTAACAVRDAGATTDGLAVFFHPAPGADVAATVREIRSLLVRRTGLNPRHIVPVRKEDVPKTEIGKIQRAALRRRFHSGGFDAALAEVDLLLGDERTTLPNWFHERVWRPARPLPGPTPQSAGGTGGTLLVLADDAGLADRLLPELASRDRRTVRVDRAEPGTEFARLTPDRFRVRLDHAEDHGRLLDALAADGHTVTDVLDLTTYAPSATDATTPVPAETAALVHLVQALAARRAEDARTRLRVVGRHTQHAAPGDVVDADRAARLGLLTSLAQELPWLDCAHLDLPEAPPETHVPDILAELAARRGDTEAAVRDGVRLVPRLAALSPPAGPPAPGPFRRGGLVVVTGGLGGLGTEICAHLLDAYDSRLLILGRTELPPEDASDATAASDTTGARRLAAYRALRARSEHVLYATADITRADEVRAALGEAATRWSLAPTAVLHLAGTFRQRPFPEQTVEELAEVLAPKTLGTRALLDALGDAADDTALIAFSSVNGTFGGAMVSAYAAANAHLDALVRTGRERGRRFASVAWSLWDETGMSAGRDLAEPGRARGYRPIGRAEGVRSFVHALRLDRPHVLVGLDPARPWIRGALDAPARPATTLTAYTEPEPATAPTPTDRYGTPVPVRRVTLDRLPRTPDGTVDRAALRRADRPGPETAPAGKTQLLVARVWCEVLGVDRVGPDENFFDLGGHSLLMARVHGTLQTALDREFSMVDLFRHPTVATLSAFLDAPVAAPPEASRNPARDRAARRRAARTTGRGRR